uniref:hypothetical protein n=1 Tax=Bacillus pumilus TaxID=1408 RepID=UPI003F68A01D
IDFWRMFDFSGGGRGERIESEDGGIYCEMKEGGWREGVEGMRNDLLDDVMELKEVVCERKKD